jgi:hypothetical protein
MHDGGICTQNNMFGGTSKLWVRPAMSSQDLAFLAVVAVFYGQQKFDTFPIFYFFCYCGKACNLNLI